MIDYKVHFKKYIKKYPEEKKIVHHKNYSYNQGCPKF